MNRSRAQLGLAHGKLDIVVAWSARVSCPLLAKANPARQHALDMLLALDALEISFCHLATHSTGGIIAARMLLQQPQRFGRVLALDPLTPLGLAFNDEQIGLFRAMMTSQNITRAVMATAASSLFVAESLAPNAMPQFRAGLGEIQPTNPDADLRRLGGGLDRDAVQPQPRAKSHELAGRMAEIRHPHLVLWGEKDAWIPHADLAAMVAAIPDCRLVTIPGVGHSMNLESPALYAGYFGAWFGGRRRRAAEL